MKQFLRTIILFFVPIIVGFSLLEIGMRMVPNDYTYKKSWLDANAAHMHIWILGPSHELYGINPKYFSKSAFNSAHVSQSLKYDAFIFEKYIEQADSLEWVILPVSYLTLTYSIENGIEYWREKNYCIYYDCPYHRFSPKFNSEVVGNRLSVKKQIMRVDGYLRKGVDDRICDSLGYDYSYTKETRDYEWYMNGEARVKSHTKNINECQQIIIENIGYIKSIIETCKAKNVSVLLLTSPVYKTYYENVNFEQYSLMLETCENLSNEYGNVEYLNLFKDQRFVVDDFFDSDHLVNEGAEKLTKIIDEYISNINNSSINAQ